MEPPSDTGTNSRNPVTALMKNTRLVCDPIAATVPGISEGLARSVAKVAAIHCVFCSAATVAAGVAEISSVNVDPLVISWSE